MSNPELSRPWPKTLGESFFNDLHPPKTPVQREPTVAQSISFSPEKIKGILDKAYLDGFDRGMKSGHEAGMKLANEKLAVEQAALIGLMNGFSTSAKDKSQTLCHDVLALALDIAKAMLKEQLKVNQATVLPILQHATNGLIDAQDPISLSLHPDDAHIVRQYLQSKLHDWSIQEDAQIERGGCLIETSGNTIDATNANRWRLLCDALGQNNAWLEEGT
ncbi:FliH/SctL family protein [Polynucleobacter sp. CS-Odin-A6]|uniref:FliH/SctL family protein n=1 Tax=Polynucleobacter sp. CS-Odin-A6 TaxID=2689106 RepID=UPI001C0AEF0E|nr:FliH/SctL family protein [Polynucleobacter sp. CS-Odin-A6]MBU3621845.1 flagellar assembly protein FliH [Polynucleobacter sp. CS-Odin-A6]